eukprot:GHVR01163152.1.p1 GENE.GHVR01163152.1~~GHVR01163152.1.p1  ORF type:complete len:452 (+),score=49.11 GHVR01163152.1:663-2018(+)
MRVITDFTEFNKFLLEVHDSKPPSDSKRISHLLSRPGWRGVVDISMAFFRIKVHEPDMYFLGTWVNGVSLIYAYMPMGLSSSPAYLDNRIYSIIPDRYRKSRIYVHMDDIGIWGPDLEEGRDCQSMVKRTLKSHKFPVQEKKCMFGKEVIFSKLLITDKGLSLTEAKITDMEVALNEILISGQATKAGWAALRGNLVANMTMMHQIANELVKDINWLINSYGFKLPWHGVPIPIHTQMRALIYEVIKSLRIDRLQDIGVKAPTLIVDSSTEYWGGMLFPGDGQEVINLKGSHKLKDSIIKGQNTLEAEAVLRGIEKVHSLLHYGKENLEYVLNVYSDNKAVVGACIHPHKINTKLTGFYNRIQSILSFCEDCKIRLHVSFIQGSDNPADYLTRPELTLEECKIKALRQDSNKLQVRKKKEEEARRFEEIEWGNIHEDYENNPYNFVRPLNE